MSTAMRTWAQSAVVHQVRNIKQAFVVIKKDKKKAEKNPDDYEVVIKTDGVNIEAMFQHADILDLNRLYCNNIHLVQQQYGVEAASYVIIKVKTN